MTKVKTNNQFELSKKSQKLIINAVDLLEDRSESTSTWNRILKPELNLLFEMFKLSNIEVKHKRINYVLNRNVKEYNLFNTEQFKKEHMDLFEKFSTKNIRTNWTYEISEVK